MKAAQLFNLSFGFIIALAFASPALAVQDTNGNGLSDVWERHYNGNALFSSTNPAHAPGADPDADGWNNAKEAVAGTNPFLGGLPTGWVQTGFVQHPAARGVFVISWPSQVGKVYKLKVSADLTGWADFGELIPGTGDEIALAFDSSNEDGTSPDSLFVRVQIEDEDPDGDGLTTWEELKLNLDPYHLDTDRDGYPDGADPSPLTSATLTEPDLTRSPAGIETSLRAFWDFESHQNGTLPAVFPDRSGNNRVATSSLDGPSIPGMPSKSANVGTRSVTAAGTVLQNQNSWTVSGWLRVGEGNITGAAVDGQGFGNYRIVYALYDQQGTSPQGAPLGKGNVMAVRKAPAGEMWMVGGYQQTTYFNEPPNINGNPKTVFAGNTFTLPAGTTDDGEWHHFAVSRTTGSLGYKVYLDGEQVAALVVSEFTGFAYDADTRLTLGRLYPAHFPSAFPQAFVDRVRVHGRVLTPAEVESLHQQDIDGDGLPDIVEVKSQLWRDTNNNNQKEFTEFIYLTSPFEWQSADADTDGDGASDLVEIAAGTDIARVDTDGDLIPDGFEITHGLDPKDPSDAGLDPDGDGLTNLEEWQYNTDPNNPNSDGGDPNHPDTTNDGTEVDQGSDPNDPSDGGDEIPEEERFGVYLFIGDESGSESEDYVLHCYHVEPTTGQERRIYTLRSGGFGQHADETKHIFRKGETYSFQIHWQGSSLESRPASPGIPAEGADFDYTFRVQPLLSSSGILIDSFNPETGVVEWGNSILGVKNDVTNFKTTTEKSRVLLLNPKLDWGYPVEEWADIAGLEDDTASDLTLHIHLPPPLNTLEFLQELHDHGHKLKLFSKHHLPTGTPATSNLISLADQSFKTNGGFILLRYRTETLKSLGITQDDEDDDVDEFASCDTALLTSTPADASSYVDGDRFDTDMAAFGGENRGPARGFGDITKEWSQASNQFMRHGGVNPVWYKLGAVSSEKRSIREQVDWLYFSGHGYHTTGKLDVWGKNFAASDAIWSKDMHGAIIGGCSVLDLKDFRAKSFPMKVWVQWRFKGGAWSPGEAWANTGPRYVLGYAWRAALDNQGSEQIIADFVAHYSTTLNVVEAWKIANDKPLARNACMFDTGVTPHEYWYWDERTGTPVWTKVVKGAGGW